MQFLKLKRIENAKSTIKIALKIDIKTKVSPLKKTPPWTTKNMQIAKERYYRDPESRRQYQKRKLQENLNQEKEHE